MALQDAEIRAEYAYLVRGFLRLARQFEQDSLRDEASCECAQKEHLHVKSFPSPLIPTCVDLSNNFVFAVPFGAGISPSVTDCS
jgi:hypothetical protein